MKRWANDLRFAVAAAVILFGGMTVLAVHWMGTRRSVRDVATASEETRAEIAALEERLLRVQTEQTRPPTEEQGHGPGGIRCDEERWFFEGPTAATAALDLIIAAGRAGFHGLSYEGEDTIVWATFPPADVENLPVRGHVEILRWPVQFRMESSYGSTLDFLGRLVEAEPAFALEGMRLEAGRDSRGQVEDHVILSGLMSSHWFSSEGSDHGE